MSRRRKRGVDGRLHTGPHFDPSLATDRFYLHCVGCYSTRIGGLFLYNNIECQGKTWDVVADSIGCGWDGAT